MSTMLENLIAAHVMAARLTVGATLADKLATIRAEVSR